MIFRINKIKNIKIIIIKILVDDWRLLEKWHQYKLCHYASLRICNNSINLQNMGTGGILGWKKDFWWYINFFKFGLHICNANFVSGKKCGQQNTVCQRNATGAPVCLCQSGFKLGSITKNCGKETAILNYFVCIFIHWKKTLISVVHYFWNETKLTLTTIKIIYEGTQSSHC